MILNLLLLSAACLSSCYASLARHSLHLRAANNTDPVVSGSPDEGWGALPDIPDATLHSNWIVNTQYGVQLPAYMTAGQTNSSIKRAVIVLPGEPRDCWYYWNVMNNALYVANAADPSIKREEVLIFAPCFFTTVDVASGAAQSDSLVWGDTTWISGQKNVGPEGATGWSTFDVLDSLVEEFMNTEFYPNLNVVMISGHSAGAQMAQRYLTLRKSTVDDDRLHFWIANPGSLLWLTEDRPAPDDSCSGVDTYKYGLADGFPAYSTSDARELGREGIVKRYRNRYAHYAWGLADFGPGDTRCQAITQGNSHLERGQNFAAMLESMEGGTPDHTTIDWVEGVSHNNEAMMNSAAGTDKLFHFDYNGTSISYDTTVGAGSQASEPAKGSSNSGTRTHLGAASLLLVGLTFLSLS